MDSKPISCVIIDDEPLAASLLESYAHKCGNAQLLQKFTNPFDALQFLDITKPDFILLDVQMPELTGLQFMKILQKKCLVVLTTAYPEYAVNAFDLDVVDYLLKPITFDRFIQAVNKVKEKLATVTDTLEPAAPVDYIFVKSEYRMIRVNFADIIYLEGLRDYVAIHSRQGKLLTLQSMRSFEEMLPDNFIRVHKSYIINSSEITSINNKSVSLGAGVIPIGAVYAQKFKEKFNRG